MKNIATIFFDIDGTLVDHKGAQNKGIEQIRKKYLPNIYNKKFRKNWLEFTKKIGFSLNKVN